MATQMPLSTSPQGGCSLYFMYVLVLVMFKPILCMYTLNNTISFVLFRGRSLIRKSKQYTPHTCGVNQECRDLCGEYEVHTVDTSHLNRRVTRND